MVELWASTSWILLSVGCIGKSHRKFWVGEKDEIED